MPPSYGSRQYWDDRFAVEQEFNWLLPTPTTKEIVKAQLHSAPSSTASSILHIGCGNSTLSSALRDVVQEPGIVTHVDFSEAVVETGRESSGDASSERWIAADLLSAPEVQSKVAPDGTLYDVIVDKSTSDSIACGDDVTVRSPYDIQIPGEVSPSDDQDVQEVSVHPLQVLAANLAAVSRPNAGKWIAFSYSSERFSFLSSESSVEQRSSQGSLPEPGDLWTLQQKWSVEVPAKPVQTDGQRIVHRPPELCWVYVLTRTKVEVTFQR